MKKLKYLIPVFYALLVGAVCYGSIFGYNGVFDLHLNKYIIMLFIISIFYPLYRYIPMYPHKKLVTNESFHSEKMIIKFNIDDCSYEIAIHEIDFSDNNNVIISGNLIEKKCDC